MIVRYKSGLVAAALAIFFIVTGCHNPGNKNEAKPIKIDGKYIISVGNKSLKMNPAIGGRIVSFTLDGENFLTGKDVNRSNWGSTFWPSPQSNWHWPPPAVIDNKPYEAVIENNAVKMVSSKAPKSGFVITKEISGDETDGHYTLKYTITNQSDSTRKVAPWEITRVHPGCLIFFPKGEGQMTGSLASLTTVKDGIVWFRYNRAEIGANGGNHQIWANGSEGWIAVVNNGTLFVKKFPDVPLKKIAPGEGDVQIYATSLKNPDKNYVEIEPEGAYKPLVPGHSLTWKVKWYLKKLPDRIKIGIGNPLLADYVRSLIAP